MNETRIEEQSTFSALARRASGMHCDAVRRSRPPFRRLRAAALLAMATILPSARAWAADERSTGGDGDSSKTRGSTLIPFPFYMYSPETKSGVGVVVTYFHRPRGATEEQKPSTYSASFI